MLRDQHSGKIFRCLILGAQTRLKDIRVNISHKGIYAGTTARIRALDLAIQNLTSLPLGHHITQTMKI